VIDFEQMSRMPPGLRYRLVEAVAWRSANQSDIGRLQRLAIEYHENHTHQGERTDLRPDETCTQNYVQVKQSKRRANSTERAAQYWGESEATVRKRVYVVNAAEANPETWDKYRQQMDEAGSPHAAYERLVTAQREEEHPEKDSVPQPFGTVVRSGDLWQLGEHRLQCGDATIKADVQRMLGGARPHLMVTDPPYGVNYDPSWRVKARGGTIRSSGRVSNDDRGNWEDAWALFEGEVVYLFFPGIHSATVQLGLEACGFQIRAQIIWVKRHFALSRGDYHQQHEPCFYAVRGSSHWAGGRDQSTVWDGRVSNEEKTGHGTQKPVSVIIRAIENNSQPGDGVYDPFVGSGTTIIAATMTDRVCYAMDLDPAYCTVAIERWQQFTENHATLEATGQTYAEVKRERETMAEESRALAKIEAE
jgi:DNA modification methylase